jgi:hypothetical protein
MPAIERTVPAMDNTGVPTRSYKLQDTGAPEPSVSRGLSINAADLNIPGIGKGIQPANDEYIPSFPPDAAFQEPQEELPEETANAQDENEEPEKEGELTEEEQQIVADLQARDREVRAHEQAHISAGGQYITGGATYDYERGPDDKRYAVGGEVGIDSSPIRDNPEATIAKMQVVRAAALAPAEPSGQDRAVAAAASRNEAQASAELREKRMEESRQSAEERTQDRGNSQNDQNNINNNGIRQQQSRAVTAAISAYTRPADALVQAGIINFAA